MHSSLTAVVLCISAQVAAAQCVPDNTPVAQGASMGAPMIKTSAKPVVAAPTARTGGELIKTAAAGTRDAPAVARETPVPRDTQARIQASEENPQRSGTAMLLAALALMSGIVLRRFGSNKQ